MSKEKYRLSFRIKVSIIIVLFSIIPFSIFNFLNVKKNIYELEKAYISECEKIHTKECEQLKTEVQRLLVKAEYVKGNYELNSSIVQLDRMDLAETLEFIDEQKKVMNILSLEDKKCQIKWYTNQIHNSHGKYSYPLEDLNINEDTEDLVVYASKMSFSEFVCIIREEMQELKLCVYTKLYESGDKIVLFEISKSLKDISALFTEESFEEDIKALLIQSRIGNQIVVMGKDNDGSRKRLVSDCLNNEELSGYYSFINELDILSEIKLISLVSEEKLEKTKTDMVIDCLLILVLFGISVFIVGYITAYILTKKGAEVVSQLNDNLNSELGKDRKLRIVDIDFYEMEKNVFELMQKVQVSVAKLAQSEIEKKELELELLQLNFKPHLLYNTLLSVRYHTESDILRDTIDSLIHYYQLVLNHGRLDILLQDELNMVEEYLKLMIFTYDLKKVHYKIHLEEDLKDYAIPKGMLQPVVENALEHGIRKYSGEGCISINAKVEDQNVIIQIEDDGCGMSEGAVDKILLKINGAEPSDSYGLSNVRQRIQTTYGADYGITIQSSLGKGTCVIIRLPL